MPWDMPWDPGLIWLFFLGPGVGPGYCLGPGLGLGYRGLQPGPISPPGAY